MISTRTLTANALFCLVLAGTAAQAENQTLGFQLVVHTIESKVLEAPGVDGRILVLEDAVGTAVFEDGRLADKSYIASVDLDKGIGSGKGYSVYTFVNGSSITASFENTINADGVIGVYTVLGGTGEYAGASGTGSFQSAASSWEDAFLLTGEFNLELP